MYEETLKIEVNRLVNMDIFKSIKIILNGQRLHLKFLKRMQLFVSYLILENLIKRLKRKPFPISKTKHLLLIILGPLL